MDTVDTINTQINDSIQYSKTATGWSPTDGNGDCRSFAAAKYKELKKAGLPAKILYVMSDEGPHVVVESGGRILDNMTNDTGPIEKRKDLAPAYWFDDSGVYKMDGTRIGGKELIKGFE